MPPKKYHGKAASGAFRKAAKAASRSKASKASRAEATTAQAARPAERRAGKTASRSGLAVPKKAPKTASGAGRSKAASGASRKQARQGPSRKTIRVQGLFRQRHWVLSEHQDWLICEIERLAQRKPFKGLELNSPTQRKGVVEL